MLNLWFLRLTQIVMAVLLFSVVAPLLWYSLAQLEMQDHLKFLKDSLRLLYLYALF